MIVVRTNFKSIGVNGVPKGFVEAKKRLKGNTPSINHVQSFVYMAAEQRPTLSGNLTKHSSLSNSHGNQISKCRHRYKDRQDTSASVIAEYCCEEFGSE